MASNAPGTHPIKEEIDSEEEFDYGGKTVEDLQKRVRHLTRIIRNLNKELIAEKKLSTQAIDHGLDMEDDLEKERQLRKQAEKELDELRRSHQVSSHGVLPSTGVPHMTLPGVAHQFSLNFGHVNIPSAVRPTPVLFPSIHSSMPAPPPALFPELYNRYLTHMHSWRAGQSNNPNPMISQTVSQNPPSLPVSNMPIRPQEIVPSPFPQSMGTVNRNPTSDSHLGAADGDDEVMICAVIPSKNRRKRAAEPIVPVKKEEEE